MFDFEIIFPMVTDVDLTQNEKWQLVNLKFEGVSMLPKLLVLRVAIRSRYIVTLKQGLPYFAKHPASRCL